MVQGHTLSEWITIHDVWNKLIEMYGTSDLATRDQAIYEISRIDSEDFRSLSEYAEHIKKHVKTLEDMGVGLPQWMLSTFFRLGLKEDRTEGREEEKEYREGGEGGQKGKKKMEGKGGERLRLRCLRPTKKVVNG